MRKFIEKCLHKYAIARFKKIDLVKISVYLKILIIILASWFLFGGKMVELFKETILTPWFVFTVYIVALAILSLYQKRGALKILVSMEDRKPKLGVVLFALSMLTYVSGAYFMEGSFNILLTGAFSLFLVSALMLTFNYRIPRDLPTIFVSISLIFLPLENYGNWPPTTRVLLYAIAVLTLGLLALTTVESFKKGEEDCPLCSSRPQSIDFCLHCGRKTSAKVRRENKKRGVLTAIFVLLVILIMNFVSVPTLYLSSQKGCVLELYTAHGRWYESSIHLPSDYVLISSERLSEYERQTFEDLALLADFQKGGNIVSVLLEVGEKDPYFMGSWQLPGWDYQKLMENVPITEAVWGKSYVLRREENSLVVLRTITLTLTFKGDLLYASKKAGVNAFINFSHPIDDIEIFNALNLLRKTCALIVDRLFFAGEWTNRLYVLSQVYDIFKDYLLSAWAVLALFTFSGWARHNDHSREKIVDMAFFSSAEEMRFLAAIIRLKKRRFTGKQLFRLYATQEDKQTVKDFMAGMKMLENKGFLHRDLAIIGRELKMVWVSVL